MLGLSEFGVSPQQDLAEAGLKAKRDSLVQVPELLRLGAWDLVCGWTTKRPECVELGPISSLEPFSITQTEPPATGKLSGRRHTRTRTLLGVQ